MVEIKGISKKMGELPVLEEVNFKINDGEIVALIGPSGCGKSTLFNIISRLDAPDSGSMEGIGNSVACVFQDDRLLPWRTVWDNIRLVREPEDKARVQELIDEVGLKGFEGYYPSQLSGGMQKRCGIARAFYYNGDLLLMDEPFQGLDYCLRHEMISMLLKLWRTHRQSVLFVTHEIDEALTVAGRILILSKRPGRVVKEIRLPDYEGRDLGSPKLMEIRQEIISIITG
ncbi:ABC transporter ATP-binding protein [Lacrimispora sp.]|uniref:ABC transporter ATP-binding protein n=1 Tax=Lacrimispora sp. TaxID=2719234 RepID=UPI002FDA5B66